MVAAAAVLYFTGALGVSTGPGPIVKPESATVFSPGGTPDNPQDAGKAIDGDPDTAWKTVTYRDADPFPTFIEGQGLMLHLSEPTALSAVTIDISSTGTEVQIRSSPTEKPAALSDTTEAGPHHDAAAGAEPHRSARPDQDIQCAGVDFEVGHDRRQEPHGNLGDHSAGGGLRSVGG